MKEAAEGNDGRSPPNQDQDQEDSQVQSPPSPRCEELFCGGGASFPMGPLAGALGVSGGPQGDVVKRGYLGKEQRGHRRFFVLRAGSHTGPSRLEWYKNQEKFSATHTSASRAALFNCSTQGVIYLRCCLGVSRICGSRKGHVVALYARDQTVALVMEEQQEQEEWYAAMKELMEEELMDEEHPEEEDDGYCTLPPAASFKEVWPVWVKSNGPGGSRSLTGENRLCLTATSLVLVRVVAGGDLPSVTIPLLSVRRFGHREGWFFLELGRSAPHGPGEIWMEARDRGNHPELAQHIHKAVRDAVRDLRVLPDFSRSPSYNKSPSRVLMVSRCCRPKYRDQMGIVRPRNPETQSSLSQKEEEEDKEGEEEEEGGRMGYMVMSPQVSHSQEDYVTMTSPQKPSSSCSSSFLPLLQSSFTSSTLDSDSPLDWSSHRIPELFWGSSCVQSETTTSCSAGPQPETGPAPPPAPPPPPGGVSDGSNPLVDAADEPVRRSWLSSCLQSCLHPDCL